MTPNKLTPYQRIVRAAKKGCGIRLSADEVFEMSKDSAIFMLADNDDEALRQQAGAEGERS